jgi:hypothetical protein
MDHIIVGERLMPPFSHRMDEMLLQYAEAGSVLLAQALPMYSALHDDLNTNESPRIGFMLYAVHKT